MYPGSINPGLFISVILCFVERPDRGKTKPAHCCGRLIAIPVLTKVTSLDFNITPSEALMSYPISDACFCEGTFPLELISCISISIFLFNGNLSLMNIRDYLFIRKAKISNKIKILDVLGFETDSTIIQTPEILKEIDNLRLTEKINVIDDEISSEIKKTNSGKTADEIFNNQVIDLKIQNTEAFSPIKVTSQIKKLWIDLEKRRQWFIPLILITTTISILIFVSLFFINMRNESIISEEFNNSITLNTNENIQSIMTLLESATDPFYSRYDISNASANLQIIESSLIEYEQSLSERIIDNPEEIQNSLTQIFELIDKLDRLYSYRIIHSEILIYDDLLDIDDDTNINELANNLSSVGAISTLNSESLPDIEELKDHKDLLISALITSQDLHGRLIASLRNNESEVAQTLINAIILNKDTEIIFFNTSLKQFYEKYAEIIKNIPKLP